MPKPPKWQVHEAVRAWGAEITQRVVTAADFKTHCLSLIDEVMQSRSEVVVTRYGKPVAKLVAFDEGPVALFGHLSGTVAEYGDIVSPTGEAWDADA